MRIGAGPDMHARVQRVTVVLAVLFIVLSIAIMKFV